MSIMKAPRREGTVVKRSGESEKTLILTKTRVIILRSFLQARGFSSGRAFGCA